MPQEELLLKSILENLGKMKGLEPRTYKEWLYKLECYEEDLRADTKQAIRWASFSDEERPNQGTGNPIFTAVQTPRNNEADKTLDSESISKVLDSDRIVSFDSSE